MLLYEGKAKQVYSTEKENEYVVKPNKIMNGAWDVKHNKQKRDKMHLSGWPVDYSQIKGISMTKKQMNKNFGRKSMVLGLYKKCNYTIEKQ